MSASVIEVALVFFATVAIGGAVCELAELAAGIIDRMVSACVTVTKLRSRALCKERAAFSVGYWVEEYETWGMANEY